jgi:V/A-type H+-transporting ATPase subunit I
MSIEKMKRIRLLGMRSDKDSLLRELMILGCVQVGEFVPSDPEAASMLNKAEVRVSDLRAQYSRMTTALAVLDKYAAVKSGMFAPKPEVPRDKLFDDELLSKNLKSADELCALEDRIKRLHAEESSLRSEIISLSPWTGLDVPLNAESTKHLFLTFGTLPRSVELGEAEKALYEMFPETSLFAAGSDRDIHALLFISHAEVAEQAMALLRTWGFSVVTWKNYQGTAAENISRLENTLRGVLKDIETCVDEIKQVSGVRSELKLSIDRMSVKIMQAEAAEKLSSTDKVFALEGWLPAEDTKRVEELLGKYVCAWEFMDPLPEEASLVPIKLRNNRLTEPLSMVSEMYSLPAYDGIDPNPLIMPFFTAFFGIMYADMAYGAILILAGALAKLLLKPKGTMKHMTGLLIMCGFTTVVFGFLFGSFFGDLLEITAGIKLWSLINPMSDPMTVLIASLVVGFFQILVGMGIKAYMLIRDGHPLDALFDVGSWWLLFAGIAVGALGHGWYVAIAGAAALILTQGRAKPTIMGKIIGGLASLYDITGYFGDVLSYSRLMALMLATGVISSVINTLGNLVGNVVVSIIILIIGHSFNMGISIIGTYVHAARLQYLEYFGKFYMEGGRAFEPLRLNTKYVNIIKEEQ